MLPNIYSRRAGLTGPHSDVLEYADIPLKVCRRLLFEMREGIPLGTDRHVWSYVTSSLKKELGVNDLTERWPTQDYPEDSFSDWIEEIPDNNHMLDALDLWATVCEWLISNGHFSAENRFKQSVERINERLREAGVGFRFHNNQIVKITSQLLHEEISIPALDLLSQPYFSSANTEFLKAYANFKNGDFEGCNVECCKALESMLKILGEQHGWGLTGREPLAKLFQIAKEKAFIPGEIFTQFNQLLGFLQCGVGATRNHGGGHGSGTREYEIPEHLAALQLHQTASVMLFLGACERAISRP